MADEISIIKEFFDSHHVRLSLPWLNDCIKWCKEEALPNNYTIKDLKYKVFEQWLLMDLRDLEIPSLPPNLDSELKYILNGNYCVQLMKVVDISKSKYSQLQRIRNTTYKNLDTENLQLCKRVLMLTLSDGVQEIQAMEYTAISALNLNLTPGIKIRLMGPITIRRGCLMLEKHNISVIGGEVDTLTISNAAENLLALSLNLPLNPNPNVIQESMLTADTDLLETSDNSHTLTIPGNQLSTIKQTVIKQESTNQDNRKNLPNNQEDLQALFEEEELRMNEEIDNLMEIEREFEQSSIKKHSNSKSKIQSTPDMFEDMDIDDAVFANINISTSGNMATQKISPLISKHSSVNKKNPDLSSSLDSDNDVFQNFDIDAHLDKLDKKIDRNMTNAKNLVNSYQSPEIKKIQTEKPINVDKIDKPTVSQPKMIVWTISKLKENLGTISNGKFKIKAKFQAVVEKLTLKDQQFHLVINVQDGSGDIIVKVQGDVIAEWAGCTALEMNNLKSGIQENMTDAQNKILKILQTLKENLQKLDNIVEILVNSKESYPILRKIVN